MYETEKRREIIELLLYSFDAYLITQSWRRNKKKIDFFIANPYRAALAPKWLIYNKNRTESIWLTV